MAFVFVRRWWTSAFKNIILDFNGWGIAVVKVKKFPSLSEKRNTEKCFRKLAVANNAQTMAMHQHKVKLHAGTTTKQTKKQKQER